MSNEKMREEFEAWVSEAHAYTGGLTRAGHYYTSKIDDLWECWKASRAALCVELPHAWYQDQEGYILNREDDVKSSLDDAGVRYK